MCAVLLGRKRDAVVGLLSVRIARGKPYSRKVRSNTGRDQGAVALENARMGGEVRIEMEGRLRASEGAGSAKDRALATLAHDIRSPLSAIEGYCALMEDELYGPITDRQREGLGRIRMSGRHLLSLLDMVMDMARLNAGVVAVATVPTRLVDVAREAIEILTPASMAKRQTLELSRIADVVVLADHARVRQVLVNLLGNAVKFTPEHGAVFVTVTDSERDGPFATAVGEVRITDTGPGIPIVEQTAIFEPYYRSEGTAQLPGIGLGLAISQLLVKQMGGELGVSSEIGRGATFTVLLPLAPQ